MCGFVIHVHFNVKFTFCEDYSQIFCFLLKKSVSTKKFSNKCSLFYKSDLHFNKIPPIFPSKFFNE